MTAQVLTSSGPISVFTISNLVYAAGSFHVEPLNNKEYIKGNLTFLEDNLKLVNSTVGHVGVGAFQALFNLLCKVRERRRR